MDHFLVHKNLVELLVDMNSWVDRSYMSDHLPIIMKCRMENAHMWIPFKFHRVWLEGEYFNDMVSSYWASVDRELGSSVMHSISQKINYLKSRVRFWERRKKHLTFMDM